MAKKQTPQQKKETSLERDRRNAYGENSKSSRKAIPLRKKAVIRSNRRAQSQPLRQPAETPEELAEIENAALARRPREWTKSPDVPLEKFLEVQAVRRRGRQDRKATKKKPGGASSDATSAGR